MIPWRKLAVLAFCSVLAGPHFSEAQLLQVSSRWDDALLEQAVAATKAGDLDRAATLYRRLERSPSSWHAWAGKSGQVAIHRMAGDADSARAVTARISAERPELAGLAAIWDGDTAMLEGDPEGAIRQYQLAFDSHGEDWVDGTPMGAVALRQIARARLEVGDPRGAAEAERRLLGSYPEFTDRPFSLASILAFEAMESGELPVKPLQKLLEDGDCSPSHPCVLSSGGRVSEQIPDGAVSPRGMEGIYFLADTQALEAAGNLQKSALVPGPSSPTACTTPTANNGFQVPMVYDACNNPDTCVPYLFMEYPDSGKVTGYHPGIDLNRGLPGADCGDPFYSTARGCVRDVMSSQYDWGSATVEHFYMPGFWASQYGHAYEVFYSVNAAIAKGAPLGKVGGTGGKGPNEFACHLHFEIRESDHTERSNASAYHNASLNLVGDHYQDPIPFIAGHPAYHEVRWVDENSFTFTGTWTTQTGIGDMDDLRWADTTSTKTNYARYEFTPTTTGAYHFYAFIPWNHRPATKAEGLKSTWASYRVVNKSTGGTVTSSSVNQSVFKDAWRHVGAALLAAGTPYYLEVETNTGESGKKVVVDDFLILRPAPSSSCVVDVTLSGHWKGEYFNNPLLDGAPVMVRDDGTGFLNFDWGGGSPGSTCNIGPDGFSARWTRTAYFNAGTYRFDVTSDDGFRLYIDGVLQMQAWIDQGPTPYSKLVALSAGNHTIKMEYYERGGGAVAKLSWQNVSSCFANVPSTSWKGEYFLGTGLAGDRAMIRNDGTGFLNFNWGYGSPSTACSFPANQYSVRWTRTVYFPTGTYQFNVTSDDGFQLYVDGVLRLQRPIGTASVNVSLAAGNHTIRMDYFENTGAAVAKLSWKTNAAQGTNWSLDLSHGNAPLPENGRDLTNIDRFSRPGGPCHGKAPGTCRFDTRTVFLNGGHRIESITTPDGKFWHFDLDTTLYPGWSNNGSDNTTVERYMRPSGPCYQKATGTCRFDTRTLFYANGHRIESITTPDGKFWHFDVDAPGLPGWSNNGTDNTKVERYMRSNGPCYQKAAGTCRFDTRTIFYASNGHRIESITTPDGKFWHFDVDAAGIPGWGSNGRDMTTIGRYMNGDGPCQGKAPGTCRFDTRVVWEDANKTLIESMSR